jgi:4-amino-4-deoxy-L-arabinose transferase-like glycosyltransferase
MLVFLPGLGVFGILDPSDGLYTECAREMLQLHNFMTPHFGYQPFLEKPILIYWAILISYKFWGISEWAARLPSALSGVLCAVSVLVLTAKCVGRRTAVVAALMLVSAPLFVVIGHLALSDMLVTLFMTTALLATLARLQGGGVGLLGLSYLCLGLLTLTKGPVPVLFVGGIVALYLACLGPLPPERWYHYWWRQAKGLHPIAGTAFILMIAAPWYMAENAATHGAFFQEFFVRQNLGRAAGTVNHQEPWNFYIPYLVGGLLPWWTILVFAPEVIWHGWSRRSRPGALYRMVLFCSIWSLAIIVLFSLIRTKLATYVLPACPAIAILAAATVTILLKRKRLWPMALTFASAVVALVTAWFSPVTSDYMHFADGSSNWFVVAGVLLFLSGFIAGLILLLLKRSQAAVGTALFCSPLALVLLVPAALHIYDNKHDKPYRDLVKLSQRSDATTALFMRDSPAALFYSGHQIPILNTADELRNFNRTAPGKHLLIVDDDVLVIAVQRAPRLNMLARKSKYTLFCIDK